MLPTLSVAGTKTDPVEKVHLIARHASDFSHLKLLHQSVPLFSYGDASGIHRGLPYQQAGLKWTALAVAMVVREGGGRPQQRLDRFQNLAFVSRVSKSLWGRGR